MPCNPPDQLTPLPELKSANGSKLDIVDLRSVPISIKQGQSSKQLVYLVRNLQVPAIIRIDYMASNKLIIDTDRLKIHFPNDTPIPLA